jgi:hypothetical protein
MGARLPVEDPWLENRGQLARDLEALGSRACKPARENPMQRQSQAPRLQFEDTWRDMRDLDYCFQNLDGDEGEKLNLMLLMPMRQWQWMSAEAMTYRHRIMLEIDRGVSLLASERCLPTSSPQPGFVIRFSDRILVRIYDGTEGAISLGNSFLYSTVLPPSLLWRIRIIVNVYVMT